MAGSKSSGRQTVRSTMLLAAASGSADQTVSTLVIAAITVLGTVALLYFFSRH